MSHLTNSDLKVPFFTELSEEIDFATLLDIRTNDGFVSVRCPYLKLEVFHKVPEFPQLGPSLDDIAENSIDFSSIGNFGFTLGKYSEIFVTSYNEEFIPCFVQFNDIEFSFGKVTPLARYIFNSNFNDDIHYHWNYLWSIRIWNCPKELIENIILNGIIAMKNINRGVIICEVDYNYPDIPEDVLDNCLEMSIDSPVLDIEPLRLYYYGAISQDTLMRILFFYRVLEYYSVLNREREADAIRRKSELSPREFLAKMMEFVKKDEKDNLCRLVTRISNDKIIEEAFTRKIIISKDSKLLAKNLYEFRNRIIHAKINRGAPMFAPSIFDESNELKDWRFIIEMLAEEAINISGTRL